MQNGKRLCIFVLAAFILSAVAVAEPAYREIKAYYTGISVKVNGTEIQCTDVNGKSTEPFIYDGTTYLPARAIAEALGKEVLWNESTNEVIINDIAQPVQEPVTETVKDSAVSSTEELLNAIKSNTRIQLEPGEYNLSDVDFTKINNSNIIVADVYDGKEIIVKDVENFAIIGNGTEETSIIVNPRYANVFTFEDCTNIALSGLKMGHSPEQGSCVGGVVALKNVLTADISECLLYGCGISGINAENVKGITCMNDIIEDCSETIMTFYDAEGMSFEDCIFRDCEGGIVLGDCSGVYFGNCELYGNVCDCLIETYESIDIKLEYTKAHGNKTAYDIDESVITLVNTTIE